MGEADIEFAVADFVAAGAVGLNRTAVAFDWGTVERVAKHDDALEVRVLVLGRERRGK